MKLVFATQNQGKLKEVQLLMPEGIELLSLQDIGCDSELEETQDTIVGNAIQKARFIKEHFKYDCFADDTGLEVDALNGAPGVYSARYAGEEANANSNMEKLLTELGNETNRSAAFKTVIALIIDGELMMFTGLCEGQITDDKSGDQGFGYDPIFKPNGYNMTFAEMDIRLKNEISHRSRAVRQLVDFLANL